MQRIIKPGQAEQTINKSRFIAIAEYCNTEREVGLCLRKLANANQNAHHLAYAFRIKTEHGIVQRFHDAGEPSGTAGKPILQFVEGRDLINVCVGVIRYYGGINLGTGGLARAYGGTAKMAIDNAQLAVFVEMQRVSIVLEYKELDFFSRELTKLGGVIIDKGFEEKVMLIVEIPKENVSLIIKRFGSD